MKESYVCLRSDRGWVAGPPYLFVKVGIYAVRADVFDFPFHSSLRTARAETLDPLAHLSSHSYTWDAEGKMISQDTTAIPAVTYDAVGRMVEQNRAGTYFQIVYSPMGTKLAVMKAQVIQQAFVPLPGGATAEYLSWD